MNPFRKWAEARAAKQRIRTLRAEVAEKGRKSVSLAENFLLTHRERDPVAPWVVLPQLGPFDIGWRMGPGEYYLHRWAEIFGTFSQEEKEFYFLKYDLGPEWPYRDEWYEFWIAADAADDL